MLGRRDQALKPSRAEDEMRPFTRAVAGVALSLGVGLLTPARPALAETACVDVWLEQSGQPNQYVLGPDNCYPTPFTRWLGPDGGLHGLPTPECLPDGVAYHTWITFPL